MLQVRMEFNLVDRGRHFTGLEDPVQLLWLVVADADGFGQALALHFFHLPPFFLVFFFLLAEEWRVNQVAFIINVSIATPYG